MIGDWRECKETDRNICVGCFLYDQCNKQYHSEWTVVYIGAALAIVIALIIIL